MIKNYKRKFKAVTQTKGYEGQFYIEFLDADGISFKTYFDIEYYITIRCIFNFIIANSQSLFRNLEMKKIYLIFITC